MGHNIPQSYPMISDENPVVGYALIWTFYHKICQYKTFPNSINMLMMVGHPRMKGQASHFDKTRGISWRGPLLQTRGYIHPREAHVFFRPFIGITLNTSKNTNSINPGNSNGSVDESHPTPTPL